MQMAARAACIKSYFPPLLHFPAYFCLFYEGDIERYICRNLKFSKPGFSNTVNFLMFKLVLEKAEEPEFKLPTFAGSLKKQESYRKKNIYFDLLTMPSLWQCGSQQTMENSLRDGNTRPPDLPPEKSVCRSRSNSQNWTWKNRLISNQERRMSKLILSPCLFNWNAEYIMWNTRLDEAQAGIKTVGRNVNNFRYADDPTLMAESKEELKSLLMKVKDKSEKVGLKVNIHVLCQRF